METFKILRYVGIETIVEAENADEALEVEEKMQILGDLNCPEAKAFNWWISEAIGTEVRDINDNVLIENW